MFLLKQKMPGLNHHNHITPTVADVMPIAKHINNSDSRIEIGCFFFSLEDVLYQMLEKHVLLDEEHCVFVLLTTNMEIRCGH